MINRMDTNQPTALESTAPSFRHPKPWNIRMCTKPRLLACCSHPVSGLLVLGIASVWVGVGEMMMCTCDNTGSSQTPTFVLFVENSPPVFLIAE